MRRGKETANILENRIERIKRRRKNLWDVQRLMRNRDEWRELIGAVISAQGRRKDKEES